MTTTQSYFVEFIRFAKDAIYSEGVTPNKPCVPANCRCCYWKPLWRKDFGQISISSFGKNENGCKPADSGGNIDGISVLAC